MYKITMQNKNGRVLREHHGIELPEDQGELNKAIEYIWLGMASACMVGRIIVTNEDTGKIVEDKAFISTK